MYNIVETGSNIYASPQYKPMIESMIAEYKPAKNNAECPFRHQPSRHSAVESESIRKEVDVWLQDGIVRKSSLNSASRVVVVKKKDGTDRICVDFRQLNSMVLKDCFPVPRMDDVLFCANDVQMYS
ncbi:GM10168 [Drosophila sechellia]|uniref:GM10168 n=1 Tax=Drosophila sechellia TaxID=7238 RepID=B4IN40_DROSE|nr:GM10168 [Drosophila sechellia]